MIIVGAGAAGLGCATRLAQAGVPFMLLEAATRVGGRAHTSSWADGDSSDANDAGRAGGDVLELGATWLHGTEGHPLYELALQADLLGEPHARPAERSNAPLTEDEVAAEAATAAAATPGGWLLPGGERASGAELRPVLQTAERLMDEAADFVEAAASLPDEATVGEWVREQFAAQPRPPTDLQWAACEWRLRLETSISGAEVRCASRPALRMH